MEFSNRKMKSVYRGWFVLEIFKASALIVFLFFPELWRSILYYLIFVLFFLSAYSLYRTFPLFKHCLGGSIFEEYEPKRLVYVKYRNHLFLIMFLDIFPILIIPQPTLRFIYWWRNGRGDGANKI